MTNASQHETTRPADAGPCRIGGRLACDGCGTALVVLDVRGADVRIQCCGQPMTVSAPIGCGTQTVRRREQAGLRAGRLYDDPQTGLVLRCIRAGASPVTVDGRAVSPRLHLAV